MDINSILKSYQKYEWYQQLEFSQELFLLEDIKNMKRDFIPKIALIGEFSSGKSSVINAILGQDLLPVNFKPETKYITEIKYSQEEYIFVNNKKVPLTLKNIKKIITKDKKIELYVNNDILHKIIFIDTPGTNDSTTLNDDVVFELLGNVDLVMFVTNSTQAFTESEKIFLSKIIKTKDLEKFFFVLNFADILETPKIVKNSFIHDLSSILSLEQEIIKEHTFLYSTKENDTYKYIFQYLEEFIINKNSKLLKDWEIEEKSKIFNAMLLKIEILLDNLDGSTLHYNDKLKNINQEIKIFENAIAQEIEKLEEQISDEKENSSKNISQSINLIKKQIENEVNEMKYSQLQTTRYIELRIKKLLEDEVMLEWNNLILNVSKLIDTFNQKIDNNIIRGLELPTLNNIQSKKVVTATALTTAGLASVSAVPIIGSGTILSSLGMAGILGTVSTIVVPVIGLFLLSTGKILFDIGKWGVSKASELAEIAEEKIYKHKYIISINKQLNDIEKKILFEIKALNIDNFKEIYIDNKFPQKKSLEQKLKLIQQQQNTKIQLVKQDKEEIDKLFLLIEGLLNEL